MDSKELELLAYEVKLLEEVLRQKKDKLLEYCQHEKIKRGKHSAYYSDDLDSNISPLGGCKYTYECLICGQKWAFSETYEKFDNMIIE